MLRFVVICVLAATVLSLGLRMLAPELMDGASKWESVWIGVAVWLAALALAGVDRAFVSRSRARRE